MIKKAMEKIGLHVDKITQKELTHLMILAMPSGALVTENVEDMCR